jgi:NADH-quinone oxidoreductase subunit N
MSALLLATTPALVLPHIDYWSILPELILLGGGLFLLGASSVLRRRMPPGTAAGWSAVISLAALVAALVEWQQVHAHGASVTVAGAIAKDGFSVFITILVTAATFLTALVGDSWMRREGNDGPEFQVLLLVSASGAVIMGAANDLIVIFLGLEILSIALYVLAAFNRRRVESGEAALKYFLLGGFSSAIFLYGIALVYGATGTTNLPQIADFLAHNFVLHNGLLLAAMALLLVGFSFKVAAVPFHLWTPDVYQGSPSPVTGYMAGVAKAGAFAALLRVFVLSFGSLRTDWQPVVFILAILTLLLGATVALVQRDIKRMLAYSSINHAGFILLGLEAATVRGVSASLYYLFAYTVMALGTFAVVSVVGEKGDGAHGLDRYRGLAARRPLLAGSLAVLLVAQAGMPFTTGFLAKLAVVSAAVSSHNAPLAVVAMGSGAIAAFFYLRVIVLMYSPVNAAGEEIPVADEGYLPSDDRDVLATPSGGGTAVAHRTAPSVALLEHSTDETESPGVYFAIALCVAVTVVFGIVPAPLLTFAHQATLLFH